MNYLTYERIIQFCFVVLCHRYIIVRGGSQWFINSCTSGMFTGTEQIVWISQCRVFGLSIYVELADAKHKKTQWNANRVQFLCKHLVDCIIWVCELLRPPKSAGLSQLNYANVQHGSLLLAWFNSNPNMDKYSHSPYVPLNFGNRLVIWSTHYDWCSYWSLLRLKWIYTNKRGYWKFTIIGWDNTLSAFLCGVCNRSNGRSFFNQYLVSYYPVELYQNQFLKINRQKGRHHRGVRNDLQY